MAVLADLVHRRWGVTPAVQTVDGRPNLVVAAEEEPQLLLLEHIDTVWPQGTLDRWPFSVDGNRATGPGVFDMKAGLVQALHAVSALDAPPSRVSLLVTSDEEIGSPTGRRFVEDAARRSRAVLVLEPSAGGALKTSRKGVSMYRLHVTGRAAHAGLEPEREINALVELATQVHRIVELGRPSAGTTVTPTTAKAGTTRNTVPAQAELAIDVRAETAAELTRVNDALRTFTAAGDARLRLDGGINRAPLESAASADLFPREPVCGTPRAAATDVGQRRRRIRRQLHRRHRRPDPRRHRGGRRPCARRGRVRRAGRDDGAPHPADAAHHRARQWRGHRHTEQERHAMNGSARTRTEEWP